MSLNSNATVTLLFGGLALCHLNQHTDLWEALFIRDEENLHSLKMIIGYDSPDAKEIPIDFTSEIRVRVKNPISKTGVYMPTKDFTRKIGVDNPFDMRWTLNFGSKELHGRAITINRGKLDNFFTTPNALFYTSQWSNKKYILQEQFRGSNVKEPIPLSAIGEYIGGDIECESDGGVSIDVLKVGGEIDTYDLTDKTIVFFDNICDQTNPKCAHDFSHYYDVLSDNEVTYELIPQKSVEESLEEYPVGGANYSCEGAWVDPLNPDPPGTLNEPPINP